MFLLNLATDEAEKDGLERGLSFQCIHEKMI